jgi:hypothetical protein
MFAFERICVWLAHDTAQCASDIAVFVQEKCLKWFLFDFMVCILRVCQEL